MEWYGVGFEKPGTAVSPDPATSPSPFSSLYKHLESLPIAYRKSQLDKYVYKLNRPLTIPDFPSFIVFTKHHV